MVTSSDGHFIDVDGASRHFSSPEDMRIFNLLRSLADVVLVGAQTAVRDNYSQVRIRDEFLINRSSPDDVPVLALVSKSLRIPFDLRLFTSQGPRPIVFTTRQEDPDWVTRKTKLNAIAEVVLVEQQNLVEEILSDLIGRRLGRILCEGGPSLLNLFLSSGEVTHIAHTVSSQRSRFAEPNTEVFPRNYRLTSEIETQGQTFRGLVREL